MQQVWFFVVVDAHERKLAYAQCDFMGIYADLMNRLCAEEFGTGWMRFTTFSQRDYNKELHGHLDLDPQQLPSQRMQFEPADGLLRLAHLKQRLLSHEKTFVTNDFVRASDFGELVRDCDSAIETLQKGQDTGHKWFLDVDVS